MSALPRATDAFPGLQLVRLLGRGGYGDVYLARDDASGEEVALKVLAVDHPLDLLAFKEEFRTLADLVHPNVVELHELHASSSRPYFTMEHVEGTDLLTAGRRLDLSARGHLALQLVEAVEAIHAAGYIHGDIKPQNVLAEATGRVVVLDLGLSRPIRPRSWASAFRAIGGSLAWLAPELIDARRPEDAYSPAVDAYAVGLVLYELLGRTPAFDPTDERSTLVRLTSRPPPLRVADGHLPSDLAEAIQDLLAPDPTRRSDLATVKQALQAWVAGRGVHAIAVPPFVGRRDEQAELERWLAALNQGRGLVGLVRGVSGVGKTALVEKTLSTAASRGDVHVLRSRCHPGEHIPFGAIDGIVTDLARLLSRWRPDQVPASLDVRSAVEVFPVLGEVVPVDAGAPLPCDPVELRRRAFLAIGELLSTAAEERPLVLWIDDVQWADRDSLELLRRVLGPARPRVGLLGTIRTQDVEAEGPSLAALFHPASGHEPRILSVGELTSEDAACLVERMTGRDADPALLLVIGRLPFLVVETLRRAHTSSTRPSGALAPEAVLGPALEALPPRALELLRALCAVGAPLARRHLLRMFGRDAGTDLGALRLARLVGTAREGAELALVVSHAYVRSTVLEGLDEPARRALHLRTAEALRAAGASPLLVVEQLVLAGERERGTRDARLAADGARDALAFALEARLRQWILDVDGDAVPEDRAALALALARIGSGRESGEAWVEAARTLGDRGEATSLQAIDYRRRAAEQFLRSGDVTRGRREMFAVLEELGVTLPRTPREALWLALWRRLRMLWRGLEVRPGAVVLPDDEHLARMDAMWSTATSLALIDHILADALCVQHLRLALDTGEPRRVLKALGYEAVFLARFGMPYLRRRSRWLADRVDAMSRSMPEPYDRAWALMSSGTVDWCTNRWAKAADALSRALDIWEASCQGVQFERASTCAFLGQARWYLGDLSGFQRVVERMEHEVLVLDNRFPLDNGFFDMFSAARLVEGDVAGAMGWIDAAWRDVPPEEFRAARFTRGHTSARVHLYADDPEAAWRCIEEGWQHVLQAGIHWVESLRIDLEYRRGHVAAVRLGRGGGPGAAGLWRQLRRDVRDLTRSSLPGAAAWAATLQAAMARLDGDEDAAAASWGRAERLFVEADMALYAHAASIQAGRVLRDADREHRAFAALRELGVVDPEAFHRALVPALDARSADPAGTSVRARAPAPPVG